MTPKRIPLWSKAIDFRRLLLSFHNSVSRLRALPKPLRLKAAAALGGMAALALGIFCWRTAATPPELPWNPPEFPSVGIEASAAIRLDQPHYKVAAIGENTPLLLRIQSVEATEDGGFLYKFSYTGLEAGVFNLTDFLLKPEGDRLKEPVSTVTVESAIPRGSPYPAAFDGASSEPKAFPYRLFLLVSALAWAGVGAFALWHARKKQTPPAPAEAARPEGASTEPPDARTLADLLRPLVEKAADKSISSEEKAQLEGLLFDYWSRELELDHLNSVEQLRRILEHPKAGALLRTIEQWLYQPDSLITPVEINAALESYLCIPSSETAPPKPQESPALESRTNAPNIIAE